jgi:cytochrome c oxidase cbb3-type subunit III
MDLRAVRFALVPLLVAACGGGPVKSPPSSDTAGSAALPAAVRYDQHIFAGGKAPPGAAEPNPFAGDARSAAEGKQLFGSMNCDGCHGGGEGWVAPSLSDGRWRYGGSDAAVYQSIFYGRPKGMPAYGGLLSPQLIWKLVTHIQSLPPPRALPTQRW